MGGGGPTAVSTCAVAFSAIRKKASQADRISRYVFLRFKNTKVQYSDNDFKTGAVQEG
jgi:hypothetical protein